MYELVDSAFDSLALDESSRRLLEPVHHHLIAAVADGETSALLEALEQESHALALDHMVSLNTLVAGLAGAVADQDTEALFEALEQEARVIALDHMISLSTLVSTLAGALLLLREAIAETGDGQAVEACRRIVALEREAAAATSIGYAAGLEEKVDSLTIQTEQLSPCDAVTGAMKSHEILEQLSLEVHRCQRMDLSLGLVELAIEGVQKSIAAYVDDRTRSTLRRVADVLRDNLRRYDSIGRTPSGEFLLVFPDISRRGLIGAVERLRRELGVEAAVEGGPEFFFALAHFDYVDVGMQEMLSVLEQGMAETKAGNDYTYYD